MPDKTENVPPDPGVMSYADRAKLNVRFDQRLRRNVLEIEVEKDKEDDEIILTEDTIAKLLNKIKLNIYSHVEGYQVSFGRKKAKIAVLCKQGLDLEQFCIRESLEVEKGVKTNFIRPAGRKDVAVTVTGLDFNTPDSLVQEYITKFGGKLITNDVIYGKYGEGPFKGKINGVRKYQVDFSEAKLQMGTFHILDGQKVKVFYRGNGTCGWCQADSIKCPGGAKAKACKEVGTKQVHLGEHMKELWSKIDFNPQAFEITEVEYDDSDNSDHFGGDRKVLRAVNFPRSIEPNQMSPSESAKFTGVRINNFPLDISDEDIVNFLSDEINEKISTSDVKSEKTKYSTNTYLGPGPSLEIIAKVAELIDYKTTSKTFFEGRKLHVQLHRPLTPVKMNKDDTKNAPETDANKITEAVNNLNKFIETPKHPSTGFPSRKGGSHFSFSSARKPSLERHKGF